MVFDMVNLHGWFIPLKMGRVAGWRPGLLIIVYGGDFMTRKAKTTAAALIADPGNQDPGKAARVEQERARLMELFTGADKNKLDFIRDTVKQLSWLAVSIHDLQSEVDEKGPVIPFRNGQNQDGLQANPACKLLIDFEKLYNTAFRALLPLVPDEPSNFDKLGDFLV